MLTIALAALAAAAPCAAEDMPGWNWVQCGNHRRGIVTTNGRRLTVDHSRFVRIDRAGHIDWSRTSHLTGD